MNKEALRKELEDAWKDGFNSSCDVMSSYVTTRLAALDDGDDVESKTLRDELAEKDSSPYNETKDARVVAFKNGWDAAEHNLKPRWFKAGGMAERILIKNPNGVDDGQEGKVVEEAVKFAEWLNDNRWFHFEKGKWSYTFEHGTAMSKKSYEKNYVKTSQELYKIFNDNNK